METDKEFERTLDILEMLDEARYLKNVSCEFKKAIRLCDKVLKIDQDNRDTMLIKAGSLHEMGEINKFLTLTKVIITKWPNHWEAYYLLSSFHFGMGEDDEALELMEKSLQLHECFDNLMSYAQILCLLGKNDYKQYLNKARKMDKKRADNFMKHHWVWDVDDVEPTLSENVRALKSIGDYQKFKDV